MFFMYEYVTCTYIKNLSSAKAWLSHLLKLTAHGTASQVQRLHGCIACQERVLLLVVLLGRAQGKVADVRSRQDLDLPGIIKIFFHTTLFGNVL